MPQQPNFLDARLADKVFKYTKRPSDVPINLLRAQKEDQNLSKLMGSAEGFSGGLLGRTEALEKLVREGIIKKATKMFSPDAGYLLDEAGDIYDIGRLMGNPMGATTHDRILMRAGLLDPSYKESMNDVLRKNNLIRGRAAKNFLNFEMTTEPSPEQIEKIMEAIEAIPKPTVSLDMSKLKRNNIDLELLHKFFTDPVDAIDTIYSFFSR